MDAMIYFAGILLVTIATCVVAVALDWLMLRAAFRLMQPAGTQQPVVVRVMATPVQQLIAHR